MTAKQDNDGLYAGPRMNPAGFNAQIISCNRVLIYETRMNTMYAFKRTQEHQGF